MNNMKLHFFYAGTKIEFTVVYSNRSSMRIAITPPDEIKVTAPKGVSETVIINCVKEKAPWILKKLYMVKSMDIKPKHEFNSGETFLYLGKEVELKVEIGVVEKVYLNGDRLEVTTKEFDKDVIRNMLELWYRQRTLEKVLEKIKYYNKYFHESPRNIKVKEQKRRWASCTYYNDILVNWRCSMAKEEVIDYIVVHEMCHMVHKNHSREFWNLVASILPSYKIQKQWLKENGARMEL
jgi:predicted metal-dependent hydrolase